MDTLNVTPPPSDRVVKDVTPPIAHRLDHDALFKPDGTVDIAALQKHLFGEGKLHHEDIIEIINRASELLQKEANLLEVGDPITGSYITFTALFNLC